MAEEKSKKEEFREFQRKIKESIRDQMITKAQSKEGLLDESSAQLNNGGGDDKDGAGEPPKVEDKKE